MHAQLSQADRSGSTWLEVCEETERWATNGAAPVPDVTLCSTFQPIFSLRSSDVAGTEALRRAYLNDGAQTSPPAMFGRRPVGEAVSLDKLCHRTHLHNAAGVLHSGERLFLNFRPETLFVSGYAGDLVRRRRGPTSFPARSSYDGSSLEVRSISLSMLRRNSGVAVSRSRPTASVSVCPILTG
jgi:EAL domain-containing protein (putative c-di-GMP-specific phosphodiesterase class I)